MDPVKVGEARKVVRAKVLGADVNQGLEAAKLLELQYMADTLEAMRIDFSGVSQLLRTMTIPSK